MFNRLLNLKYFLIISLYLFIAIGAAAATTLNEETKCTVVINELMSAKQRLIADEDGDYNDWVELYNCTDKNLELTNWYLSDRLNNLKKWQFPKIHIPAKGFLTLWVSGKDKVEQNGNSEIAIHTNFKIKRTGEPIILSNTRGEIIDQSPHIALSAHEVAGRLPDGGSEFFILKEPSPNAKNESAIAPIHIESPTFSHQSGFYDEPFELSLMHPNEQAVIYYTLDGSEPDPENLNGQTYQYKNHYQLPTASNEVINTNEQLLQNTYITYPYTKPIQLSDRNYEPDRIARIATTIEEEPNYFPKPEPSKHWMNRTIHTFNNGLAQINRGIGNLNRLLNRIGSKIKQWHTEEPQRPGQKQFIPEVKELPYWEYTGKNLLK